MGAVAPTRDQDRYDSFTRAISWRSLSGSVPSIVTTASRPLWVSSETALAYTGPASRCQRTDGGGSPAAFAIPRPIAAAARLQENRIAGFMNPGSALCTGEQVSWKIGLRV